MTQETQTQEEVRPILKKTTSFGPNAHHDAHHRHMKWDEGNLKENAEYMATHPKMKIDEPPTPYNEYHADKDHELARDLAAEEAKAADPRTDDHHDGGHSKHHTESELHARMVMAGSLLEGAGKPSVAHEGEQEHPTTPDRKQAEEDHEAEFKKKRKAVYADEGAKFKDLLKKGMPIDDDEDDDDDDDAAGEDKKQG